MQHYNTVSYESASITKHYQEIFIALFVAALACAKFFPYLAGVWCGVVWCGVKW